jgi:sugar lactone lactonase YvrE
LHRRELTVLLALFAVAAALRLTGVDWDARHHLHPDERFLTMVAADVRLPDSIGGYFDTSRSPLNPANVGHGYFTYGTLPLFVVRAAADAVGLADYDHLPLIGRVGASLADLATLLFACLIARRLGGPGAGLRTAALLACSVISIQQAHFFTVDSFAACFATAALLMLVEISRGAGLPAHTGFGAAIGLMLACRINLLVLASTYPIALAVLWTRPGTNRRRLAAGTILAIAAAAVTFRICQPYAFAGPFWGVPILAPTFVESMRTILAVSTGAADFPPSVQWIGRVPVLYPGSNLFIWGLGPAWGLAAIVAIAWATFNRTDLPDRRERTVARLIVSWAAVLFFFQATQFVATLRYFLPVVPAVAIVTGCWLTALRGRVAVAVSAVVVLLTAGWAVSFTSIYRHPHTRVSASAWIYDTLPPGATIATEHWDDTLPLALSGRSADRYGRVEMALYEEETEAKRAALISALDTADAIVLSSNRLYRSIPRAPWRYPVARRYYELLFAGQLGFQLDRVFASYPRIGSLEVNDDGAEEAFTVYDHPKVLIFRKTSDYSHDLVATQLGAVSLAQLNRATPRAASALFRQMRPAEVPLPGDALQPLFSNGRVSINAPRALSAVRTVLPLTASVALHRLREPRGLARAADGTFAIADFGNSRIVLADPAGTLRMQFGQEGEAPAEFRDPCALVFDADGTLVVADTWNHRIQRLTRGGQMLSDWRGDLWGPRGIARASDGSYYVSDTGHHRVVRFAPNGTVTEVVRPGVLDHPVGIVLSTAMEIFVADVGHGRIAAFSADGALLRSWAIDGWSAKSGVEPQLALGPDGVLWVTDPPAGRVLLFDQGGRHLGVADAATPLGAPTGIAIIDRVTAMVSDARKNQLIRVHRPPQ